MITISATITIIVSDNNEQPPHAAKPLTHTKNNEQKNFSLNSPIHQANQTSGPLS